ncbi:MAG: hypothetical protein MR881_09475 [Bacteroidales bacterium]|nr:hypothetical protein [Bacteroidales bacterium]
MNKRFFFLLTLLFAFLGGVKSEAQISATSEITNQKAYTIKSVDRGYFYFNTADNTTLYSSGVDNVPPTSSQANNQFAFLRGLNTPSGEYYLYSVGAQKFVDISAATTVGGESIHGMLLSDTPSNASKITLTQTDNARYTGYIIKYVSQSGKKVNVTSWHHYGNTYIKIFTCDTDGGNVMKITQAAESFVGFADAMKKIYAFEGTTTIKTNCESKVGYPKTSTTAYQNFESAFENGTLESSHLTALYGVTDVNMPEDGKAYRVYAKYLNGKKQPLYWNGSAIRAKNLENITNPDDAVWVFHKIPETDNKYLLVNHNGKYLIFFESESSTKGQNTNGCTDDYSATNNNFTISRANITKTGASNIPSTLTNADLFGCFELNAMGKNNTSYYLIPRYLGDNTDASFHAGSANEKYYMSNGNTYIFEIEEVDYYNKLKFQTPSTPDGNDYASIYLPYAATVPTGATAYIGAINTNSNTLTLTEITDGIIPKNTAVVMSAPTESALGTVYVAPATERGTTETTNNILKGTVNANDRARNLLLYTYVLNGGFGEIGFYKYTASNLPLGRAYFEVATDFPASGTGAGVQGFLFDFEGSETTGINAATLSEGNTAKTYYDLSGRRIANPKNGLYICNGKKVYIK